jgi:tetratricopeptide (TPR) repeat protein
MIMKKVLASAILIFTVAVSVGLSEPLANEHLSGLYARSIEQVLRLEPEEIDLGIAALIISEQWSDYVWGRRYQSTLDDMALEIRDRLKAKGPAPNYTAIRIINDYLFGELGFESLSKADDPNDLFLHTVLDKKRGYCLSLSILYLSLGERLGLPLYGVVVPGHFFIRYDDGQVRFNIETTGKGGTASDEHYINKFKVPEGGNGSIYMANLNKLQTLGCFFNNLGNSYSDVGNIEQALVALEKAVKINPTLAEGRTNLGNIYLQMGKIDDAIYQYRMALKTNPNFAMTHNNLANAYIQKGWINQAISEYILSLRLDSNFIEGYKNLASAYCKKKMFGQAVRELQSAMALKPEDGSLYSRLGDVYSQRGDYEEAILKYEKALRLRPNFAEAYYGLGNCYDKLGEVKYAVEAYNKALAIEPSMVGALTNLGNVYFGKQDYDAAIELYKKAIGIKPDDGWIHYNLGAAYSNKSDYEVAAEEYKKAIEIEPKMGEAHFGLGFALYRLENEKRLQ